MNTETKQTYINDAFKPKYRYNPPRSLEDEEYYDLRYILQQAKKNNDVITWRKVLQRSDEFFKKNPEYSVGCWGANFYNFNK